ncbi:MAG TPA: hypothetical protein VGQ53_19950 [Chitinophagaceae bacterium]|jgi:hypothetical protein|nr:hypothetical protein [Chitinophagaceae bacterium]
MTKVKIVSPAGPEHFDQAQGKANSDEGPHGVRPCFAKATYNEGLTELQVFAKQ